MKKNVIGIMFLMAFSTISCNNDDTSSSVVVPVPVSKDINTAERASIDRFSSTAGHLMIRTATNGLPAANVAVNFDNAPFITTGFDRNGNISRYYNFDVQPTAPVSIYVFFKPDGTTPVIGQSNIVGVIPGDAGYNDFWIVKKVITSVNYVPNSITSETEITSSNLTVTNTSIIVNCPIVPFGSTASRSKTPNVSSALTLGWYKGKAVSYFNFDEAAITATSNGMVPLSPIYVMFNDNVAGLSSGFKTEALNTQQTHNVLGTIPADVGYSPLWSVQVLNNMYFNSVTNLTTATGFTSMPAGATVNCPIVQ